MMASDEARFIDRLRDLATYPGARALTDDAAVLGDLVLTHDMLVLGVHYLPGDPPEDVAWKLVAVNLSDLAAKGATPIGALMGYSLRGDAGWDARFADGLGAALAALGVPLLGGDTVRAGAAGQVLGLTALGRAGVRVPSRADAQVGDTLYVTGTIGDAGLGLRAALGEIDAPALRAAYRRPVPQITAGRALAAHVGAMMDVSDGLLIDAARMAAASGVALHIDLAAVPLSADTMAIAGDDRAARLRAATAGDDYQLLFTSAQPLPALDCRVTAIGQVVAGTGLRLYDAAGAVPLPADLGWMH